MNHGKRRSIWLAPLLSVVVAGVLSLSMAGAIFARAEFDRIAQLLPRPAPAETVPVSTVVLDRNGQLLRPFTTAGGLWRLPVTPDMVDRQFLKMLLAYEDQHFARHHGVDWGAMLRAAGQYVSAGHIVSGGSTLTMQVARLLESGPTRNLDAKLRQIVHATLLDGALSKEQVLTIYLTMAPYGGNIEGVRAASLAYFGKEPTRLTTAEAALLVALPQAPEARRPDRDAAAALNARNRVLDRMIGAGVISADEGAAAKREAIPLARRAFPMLAAHLAQKAATQQPTARQIGLTVDARLQSALEKLAGLRANQLGPKISVAILVADQQSGQILASVGSAGLLQQQSQGFVDMTEAVRSPGSTLKPLIYGLAFELGLANPESLIEDRPTAFNGWVPVNFDGFTRGTVTIRQALTESLNIPAMVVLDAVGTPRFVARLKRAGAEPRLPDKTAPSLAMGLGGVGLTLRELVGLYAAIGRGGTPIALNDGASATPTAALSAPVLDPQAAWYVANILRDVPPPLNGSPGRIAYKTGTSYGYRDAWAIGFDGRTVIGVWVGRPDGAPVPGLSGIVSAAPILFESFDRLATPLAPFRPAPPGVIVAANSELPEPLRRFRHPDDEVVTRDASPEIAYPGDGVDVDLGLAAGATLPLVVKVRNGVPPFTYFANGAPVGRTAFARQNSWTPDGPGFVTLSVVDAEGRSDAVTVFLE